MPLPSLVVSATTERKENRIEADPNHDNPQLSISLARTAICARFAASATKVKSLRKASVVAEDFLCVGWGGAICDNEDEDEERDWCWVEDMVEDCCIDDDIVVGEAIGAFIVRFLFLLLVFVCLGVVLLNEG